MSDYATSIVSEIIREVLRAADPGRLVRLQEHLLSSIGPCCVLAVGKAAHAMAEAAAPLLGDNLREGLIVAPPLSHPRSRPAPHFLALEADHPMPTARNCTAAAAAAELASATGPDEAMVVLLSGGASALLTLPATGLVLEDIRAVTGVLLRAGATIDELNCVRKHCEQLKGGGLLRIAAAAGCQRVYSLILSDVVGDRLEVIGSGPTAPDPSTFADAISLLKKFGLLDAAPGVTRHLREGAAGKHAETAKPGDPFFDRVENLIIGSNAIAVEAAAEELRRHRFEVFEAGASVTGEASEVGRQLARRVREFAEARDANGDRQAGALVWGGETTVTVRGTGVGGRNQELALAAAIALDGVPNCMVMSFATDGVDGASAAAGAVVTDETVGRARAAGLDAGAALANNDSHTFFKRLDEMPNEKGRRILIQTGPTGTNVNDVMIGLAWAPANRVAG